jgi:hypothetical protein
MQTAMNNEENPQPRKLLRPANKLHQRRWLEQANQVSLELSGNQVQQSADPHGQVLRHMRQSQHRPPSEVATLACISLGQLYELETGGQRLFYSEALRQQAARRVAQLLGTDWDAIVAGKVTPVHPVPISAVAPAPKAQIISLHASVPVITHDSQRPHSLKSEDSPASLPPSGVALLAMPTADQAQENGPAPTEFLASPQEPVKQPAGTSGSLSRTLIVVTLCMVGLAMAYKAGYLEGLVPPL